MIAPVESAPQRSALRDLLTEFHAWMAAHAGDVYDADAELAEDRELLARDAGSRAWLARVDGAPAGCVLLYGQSPSLAEFGRLWVRPADRGSGVGRALVKTVIAEARAAGYETLGLTTPPWAHASHDLYESLGFERAPPYPETRLDEQHHDDAIFMQQSLAGDRS